MRFFANLKLIWKIVIPATFLTAIAAFIVWQAVAALTSTTSIANEILGNDVHKSLLAENASFAVNSTRADGRDMILAPEESEKEMYEKRLNANVKTAKDALTELAKVENDPKKKSEIIAIEGLVEKLLQKQSTVTGLAYANKTSDAYAFIQHQVFPVYSELTKRLDAIVEAEKGDITRAGNDLRSTSRTAQYRVLVIAIVGFLIGTSALGAMVFLQIVRPLRRVTVALKELADGHLQVEVQGLDRGDEVGTLARALQVFKQQSIAEHKRAEETVHVVEAIGSGLEALAKGNLTYRLNAQMTGSFAKLKDDFNAALGQLEDAMKAVLSGTEDIGVGANEISQAADDLSRRTEQQAASLEETAAALEQITATVKMTAQNAKEATSIVTKAKAAAEEGGVVVKTAITAMGQIEQSSKQITDIIGIIDEIAFQTNLLALNAGVEAARAGDAGKGFAVVASEVRALAQRSSQAAKEIKQLIQASGGHVASGVKYVGETGDSLRRIVEQVIQINALVSEMAGAAHQQSTGIEEVNAAVTQMDQVTQQNAAMVEQSTAAARNLAVETADLKDRVSFFSVTAEGEDSEEAEPAPAPKAVRRSPAAKPATRTGKSRGSAALAVRSEPSEDEWQEF